MTSFVYIIATKSDFNRGVVKCGQTGNPYNRISVYGTSTAIDNPFSYRALFELNTIDKDVVYTIEQAWIRKFKPIVCDDSNTDNLNSVSSIEMVEFTNENQFLDNLRATLVELGKCDLFVKAYLTNDDINGLLRRYRELHIASLPISAITRPSYSGLNLRSYQLSDINSTLHAFKEEGLKRAYWSIECGLGKTVMSFELISALENIRCLFVVPRITLLTQVIENFKCWKYPAENLYVCGSVRLTGELSDIKRITNKSELPNETPYICVITYDSLPLLKNIEVDLCIFDEGHHLVSSVKKTDLSGNLFGLSDDNIKSKWRLAITATPKNTQFIEDDELSYVGMSHQDELYGPCIAARNYVFGRDNGYLAPFDILCIKVTSEKAHSIINNLKHSYGISDLIFSGFMESLLTSSSCDEDSFTIDDKINANTILWYAIVSNLIIESIDRYNTTRIITYHTTKQRADLFKIVMDSIWKKCYSDETLFCETVHSGHSDTINTSVKNAFRNKDGPRIRILCNIRTLIEGFDEPSINTTVIVDNKFSPIECKQIVGRGNRLDPSNPDKIHHVIIPFLAYETQDDAELSLIRTTNEYKVIRYTIKNIILSHDINESITQTVWIPDPTTEIKSNISGSVDPTERVWIPDEYAKYHDEKLLESCNTDDLAKDSFYAARLWMHNLAKTLDWKRFTSESGIIAAWNNYKDTHILPSGIPHNPANVYKEFGWINWRDYTGILTTRTEWTDISPREFMDLLRARRINIFQHTMGSLRTAVETELTRKLPQYPLQKWKISVYDLAERVAPGCTMDIRTWGSNPDKFYEMLKSESIIDSEDYERLWPSLHSKYSNIPGIPTELWSNTFWELYEP